MRSDRSAIGRLRGVLLIPCLFTTPDLEIALAFPQNGHWQRRSRHTQRCDSQALLLDDLPPLDLIQADPSDGDMLAHACRNESI